MPNKNQKTKRKVGRPHIPKNQQRIKQISVRFTPEELHKLKKMRVKERTAEFIRELVLESLERKRKLRDQHKKQKTRKIA